MTKDGYTRQIYSDAVHWVIENPAHRTRRIDYVVARFPFVPGYHLCDLIEEYLATTYTTHTSERPMQTFKTLTEALSVLRVLVANSRNTHEGG